MFRLVVAIGLGAASVVALTLLTRPVVGVACAAALIGFGVGLAYRRSRGSLRGEVTVKRDEDGVHRLLVVANQTVAGRALLDEIANRCRGRRCEVLVITPALAGSRAAHWASDIDEGIELARERLDSSLAEIRGRGLQARGEIGDSDPGLAIEDALRIFAADELVISTHPPRKSRWLERGVVANAPQAQQHPLSHCVVDLVAERRRVGQPGAR